MRIRITQYVDGHSISDSVYVLKDDKGIEHTCAARSEYCGRGPGVSKNAQLPNYIETVVTVYEDVDNKRMTD